jgi:hypothetical protein
MSFSPRLPALRGGYLSVEKDPEREKARETARRRRLKMGRARGRWGLLRSNLRAEVARLKEQLAAEMAADRERTMETHRMRQLLLRMSGKEDFSAWRPMAHDIHPLCDTFFTVDEMCVHLAVHDGDLDKAAMAILQDTPPYRAVREAVEDRLWHKDGVVFAGQRLEAMTLDEAVRAMTDPEDENKSITHLNLRFVEIGDDGAAVIGAALSKTVQELGAKQKRLQKRLNREKLKQQAAMKRAGNKLPALKKNKSTGKDSNDSTVQETLAQDDHDNDESAATSNAAAKYDINDANTYCSVTHLKLSHNGITDFGAGMIATALKTPQCQVTCLELKKNPLGADGAKYIARVLEDKSNKLTELTLGLTGMGGEGVARLCVALTSSHCKLERLNLFCTRIGDAEAGSIARALASGECTSLTELVLPGTNIGARGVQWLAKALAMPKLCRLVSLNLEFNSRVGPEGAAYIAAALKTGRGSKIGVGIDAMLAAAEEDEDEDEDEDEGDIAADAATEDHPADPPALCSLTSLSLRGNNIGDLGAQCLASSLRSKRCQLLELNVEYNHIGEEGTLAIAKALHAPCCGLMRLYLFGNKIDIKAERLIAKALILKATDAMAKERTKDEENVKNGGGRIEDDGKEGEVEEEYERESELVSDDEDEQYLLTGIRRKKVKNKTYIDTTLLEDHEDKVSTVATSTTSANDIITRTIANDPNEAARQQLLKEEAEAAAEAAYERYMRGGQ